MWSAHSSAGKGRRGHDSHLNVKVTHSQSEIHTNNYVNIEQLYLKNSRTQQENVVEVEEESTKEQKGVGEDADIEVL